MMLGKEKKVTKSGKNEELMQSWMEFPSLWKLESMNKRFNIRDSILKCDWKAFWSFRLAGMMPEAERKLHLNARTQCKQEQGKVIGSICCEMRLQKMMLIVVLLFAAEFVQFNGNCAISEFQVMIPAFILVLKEILQIARRACNSFNHNQIHYNFHGSLHRLSGIN